MAEDFSKGLNEMILLLPKFGSFDTRIESLENRVKEMAAAIGAKEERVEVEAVKEHFLSQIHQVNNLLQLQREKTAQLDELRASEIRALGASLEQKAAVAHMHLLRDQLQHANVSLAAKAEQAKVDQLGKQLDELGEEMALKASYTRAEQLSKQVQVLSDAMTLKVGHESLEVLKDTLRSLTAEVAEKSSSAALHGVSARVQTLSEECAAKVNATKFDQLALQVDTLDQDVRRKAEDAKVENLSRCVSTLSDDMLQKASGATAEQTFHQLHVLLEAMAKKVDLDAFSLLGERFQKLCEDVVNSKADLDKSSQSLGDLTIRCANDSAKLKNLAMQVGAMVGATPAQLPQKGVGMVNLPGPPGGSGVPALPSVTC